MTDDRLMHYVDGELDAAGVVEIEAAMAADPALRAMAARHRALRDAAAAAFDAVLAEPVPPSLVAMVRATALIGDIAAARDRRARRIGVVERWGSLAAMLVVGVVVGLTVGRGLAPAATPLAADAGLVRGLDGGSGGAIALGVSYRDRDGRFCRVFHDERSAPAAGIACRTKDHWAVEVVAAASPRPVGAYRTAAGDLPPAVAATLDATIAGAPLDAAGEARAAARGWTPEGVTPGRRG